MRSVLAAVVGCFVLVAGVFADQPSELLGIGSYSGVRITVLQADDAPVQRAIVTLFLRYGQGTPVEVRGTTDARGLVRLQPPGGKPERFDVRVQAGEGAVFAQRFAGAPPSEMLLRLGRLSPIGGRVVDENHAPLAGSEVRVRVGSRFNAPPGERLEAIGVESVRLTTDSEGRWGLVIPEAFQRNLGFVVTAPQRPAAFFAVESRDGRPAFPPPGLFDGRHVTVLDRGLDLAGIVMLPDGVPAAGAEVRLWQVADVDLRRAVTSTDGRFVLRGCPRRDPNVVTAALEGYVMAAARVSVAAADRAILLRLEHGPGLAGRVVGPSDRPVRAGVLARVIGADNPANGVQAWLETNGAGEFRWREAPPGDYVLEVQPRGPFQRITVLGASAPGSLRIETDRVVQVALRLVRADTGEPVRSLAASVGIPWPAGSEAPFRATSEGTVAVLRTDSSAATPARLVWVDEPAERRDDGTFRVNIRVRGATQLRLRAPGLRDAELAVPVADRGPVEVRLEPAL